MSGLATGRNPGEYLSGGVAEEKALSVLCAAVSPSLATQVFTECLTSLVASKDIADRGQRQESGALARIVVLIQRILDKKSHGDVDGGERRGMECAVAGVFASARAQSDLRTVATLVCLVRRLFLPVNVSKGSEDSSAGFQEHEKWLKNLVRTSDAKSTKVLVAVLSELTPLEPIRFLRMNHRVFSADKQYLHLFGDYLLQVRSKISDLNPLHHSGNGNQAGPSSSDALIARRKNEVIIIKFVKEFAENGGELPKALVRHMNFYRHHFRSHALPVLLDSNLDPAVAEEVVFNMNRNKFDEHRANLIKTMAFVRKDKSIPAAQAHAALKEIEQAKKQRNAELSVNAKVQPGWSSKESTINESTSLVEVIENLIKSTSSDASSDCKTNNVVHFKELMESSILPRLQSAVKVCASAKQLGLVASDVLRGLLNGLATSKSDSDFRAENTFKRCEKWWETGAMLLYAFFVTIFGHKNLQALQKPFQYNLFFLACMRIECLGRSEVIGIAKLFSVIFSMNTVSSVADLCYVSWTGAGTQLTSFANVVFLSLPLRDPVSVRKSVWFAANCVTLIGFLQEDDWPGSRYRLSTSYMGEVDRSTARSSEDRLPRLDPLLQLLQWALCVPWRFMKTRNVLDTMTDEHVTEEAANVLNSITHILSNQQFSGRAKLTCQDVLQIEYRCGWGRPHAVKNILRVLSGYGRDACEVVAESSMFVAVSNVNGAVSPEWIAEGVCMFAEESMSLQRTNGEIRNGRKGVFLHHLRKCVESTGANAGQYMLDVLSRLPCRFFQGCDLVNADMHLSEFLIPCYWPFSNRWLKYLVWSLQSCQTSHEACSYAFQRNGFLVSNLATAWDAIGSELRTSNAEPCILNELSTSAATIARSLSLLEHLGTYQSHLTQTPNSYSSQKCSGPEQWPMAYGVAFALWFSVRRFESIRPDRKMDAEAMSNAVKQLVSSMSIIAIPDVMDAAMCASALIPFTYCFAEVEDQDALAKILDRMLSAVLAERVRLEEGAVPFWACEKLSRSAFVEGNVKTLLAQWLGLDAGGVRESQLRHLKSSLAVAMCLGKVFSTILLVSAEELSMLVSRAGSQTVLSILFANILTVYKSITAKEGTFPKERLSEQGMERLLSNRFSSASDLLEVMARLVTTLQLQQSTGIEPQIEATLREFPEQAEEIQLLLSTRNKLNFS
ncbi:unnamed protein product [Chondrus crispus]|uniref:Uncharacterized protein n=1 Tax=Chondrus crispus TaxID=2769 RepID=R7Q3U0_CHOCR|nr:unnamed protein product [Chondrus crispus]CDF32523.1 unnamed protein product [Chondrus crispus]|eukprot:XP_005712188.1 unnamed protein product [Chondrus crispus]